MAGSRRPSRPRTLCAFTVGVALAASLVSPAGTLAGVVHRSSCPVGMACNTAIGVAVRLPRGWTVAPPGHFPFNNLALVTLIPGRQDMDLHMAIEPFGTTTARDALATAEAGADAATQGVTLPLTRTTMSVGGLPAVRLRGLPGAPYFGQEIVVAHGGLLYGIYTFDNSRTALTPDQRQALASLRFIPRTGPALRPYGTNALVAALYNPCLDIQRTAPATRLVAARLKVSFSISPARGNEMVAAKVTGTGFRPGQEMVLTACWNRAVHPAYAWYHQIAHVHANRYGALPAPTTVPTFVMYVPSGRFRSWDVRVVATDARTGQRLAAVARGPSAGIVAPASALAPARVPPVDLAAFRGQGRLAFRWGGQLYVLDGDVGVLRHLTHAGHVGVPAWSPDGTWLAYLRITNPATGAGSLWVVRADGSAQHQVSGLPAPVQTFSWSPAANVLAVQLAGPGTQHLWLASPTGHPHAMMVPDTGVAWSSDGKTLAYGVTLPFHNPVGRSDALYTVPAMGGTPTRRYMARGNGIELAGWWPAGRGLLFWLDPQHSASIAADGLQLFTLPLGGKPRPLTFTLTYPDWLSWAPSGRTLLLVAGGGRMAWDNKMFATCDVPRAVCHTLPQPAGVVRLDPASAPQGGHIAFVQARDLGPVGGFASTQRLLSWVHTHTLWVADAHGAGARELRAAGTGIYQPQWSRDGSHLLYIRDDAVWLIGANGTAPARIVGPFPTKAEYFGYYGHVYWPQYIALAWYRR